jgi:hypothetical protein
MRPLFSEALPQEDKCASHKSSSCKSSSQQQQHQTIFFITETMRQSSNEQGQREANRLKHKMESTSNSTLQLK